MGGFFAQGKLKKTRIDGGDPISLCDAPSGRGASWGEDGNIIAALSPSGGLSKVPSAGGNPVPLTELRPDEACHRWPHVLPGGKLVLFTVSGVVNNFDEAGIVLLSLQDHSRTTLLERAGMYPLYLPNGHLLYVTKGGLFAAPDAKRLRLTGAATRLGEVAGDIPIGFAQVDFSVTGICVLRTRNRALSTLQWLDALGKTEPLGLEAARYHHLRLSPDGARLAYVSTQGPNSDLFSYDWQRGIKTRLTNGLVTSYPVWSPDGRFVFFAAGAGMFGVQTDGGGTPVQLTRSNNRQVPETFSPDGRLVFMDSGAKGEIRGYCLSKPRVVSCDLESPSRSSRVRSEPYTPPSLRTDDGWRTRTRKAASSRSTSAHFRTTAGRCRSRIPAESCRFGRGRGMNSSIAQ